MNESYLPVILAAAAITLATRLGGFAFSQRTIPDRLSRFLTDVPVAAFAALAIPGILTGDTDMPARIVAALVGAAVTFRYGKLWLCILTGLATYWAVWLLTG